MNSNTISETVSNYTYENCVGKIKCCQPWIVNKDGFFNQKWVLEQQKFALVSTYILTFLKWIYRVVLRKTNGRGKRFCSMKLPLPTWRQQNNTKLATKLQSCLWSFFTIQYMYILKKSYIHLIILELIQSQWIFL